jgi:DNA adenine methylase
MIYKSLKRRIFVDAQDNQFVQCVSPNLIEAIGLTPFSREEFEIAISEQTPDISDFERARRFFIRARQVRTGLAQKASSGRWAHCKLTSRAGMAGAVSRWLGSVEVLPEIVQRLLRVQIENDSAIKVIQRYDSEDTLFYCDPPYPHDSRGDSQAYAYEMTDEQHKQLAEILHNIQGKVAISGYKCALMDELYGGWKAITAPTKACHSTKGLRTEVLWVNYDIENILNKTWDKNSQKAESQCQPQQLSLI